MIFSFTRNFISPSRSSRVIPLLSTMTRPFETNRGNDVAEDTAEDRCNKRKTKTKRRAGGRGSRIAKMQRWTKKETKEKRAGVYTYVHTDSRLPTIPLDQRHPAESRGRLILLHIMQIPKTVSPSSSSSCRSSSFHPLPRFSVGYQISSCRSPGEQPIADHFARRISSSISVPVNRQYCFWNQPPSKFFRVQLNSNVRESFRSNQGRVD